MENIKKGDLAAVQAEQERIGFSISHLIDENFRHNCIFYSALIKDE